jgi:hypothetical protein
MLDLELPVEIQGLLGTLRDPVQIPVASLVLRDWLESEGHAALVRRLDVSRANPGITVPLNPRRPLPAGVGFFLRGGVPGITLPAGMMAFFLRDHPAILRGAGHLHLTWLAEAPITRSVARTCPALAAFTGALTLDGRGTGRMPGRFPWDLVSGTFAGIHSLAAIGCVMDHRRGLMRRPEGTFPRLRSLSLRGCSRLICEGSHLVASPMFGAIREATIHGWNGGDVLPVSLGGDGCLPELGSVRLDCAGISPADVCRMPSLAAGKLKSLQVRWINTPDGAGQLAGMLAAAGVERVDLGVFTPGRDSEWEGLLGRVAHPGLTGFGFSSHRLLPGDLAAIAGILDGSAVTALKLGDDTRQAYRMLGPLGELLCSAGAGRLRELSLRTWQPGAAELVIESGILAGLSRFKLAGRIPPPEYLTAHLLPRARHLAGLELDPEGRFGRPALDALLREGLGGGQAGVVQGQYLGLPGEEGP